MLSPARLARVLPRLPRVSVHGPWSRAIGYHLLQGPPPGSPCGARPEPLWPGGAAMRGARFTPRGGFGTIYLAGDPVTALLEVNAVFSHPNVPPVTLRLPPWALLTVEGIVDDVLDLTDPALQKRIGTNLQELTGEWQIPQSIFVKGKGPRPPTQALGQVAHATGKIRGLKFPAAKNLPTGIGLAIFADRLRPPNFLEVYDPLGHLVDRRP